ncbi:hypothetical protein QAD02_015172 [Eretmocerus hayati]|uniref:Uncharacterized protein n=1 Tax=Eretmocerus hayati TaxID=131215 RepID=A0ACC2P7J5_9HYME|nr:hypothetical protein QAD02_015172 [Eretmocerus hayati]
MKRLGVALWHILVGALRMQDRGCLIAIAVSDALKATRPKFKIATSSTTSTTTEETAAEESADDENEATTTVSTDANATTGHTLTGIPQIDYIWDPNLPRELNGYNLSDYPFYASMPEDIDFKCDGLHDGFYASVPHKCQSRGYPRRDYDDYEDRKYRRNRERERDYRHRDFRERDRERYPARPGGRREPARAREPVEDEPPRIRLRDQDSSRTRDFEDRVRDGDERRFRDDYDEKDSMPSSGNNEGLIKPAAAPASVYSRPRPPPKIRIPVPLSEQDKYAYSTSTTVRPIAEEVRKKPMVDDAEEPRRRPMIDDIEEPRRRPVPDSSEEPRRRVVPDGFDDTRRRPIVHEYDDDYDAELEDVRPHRWQMRGRPMRDRDFPEKRYRDRPYRSRYRDEEDDIRPRKHPEGSRVRYYERERDRNRDRSLDRVKDRKADRDRIVPVRDSEKPERSSFLHTRPADREKDKERTRFPALRTKEPQEETITDPPRKAMMYERSTTEEPFTIITSSQEPDRETTSTQAEDSKDRNQKYSYVTVAPKIEPQEQQEPQKYDTQSRYQKVQEVSSTERELPQKYWKTTLPPETYTQSRDKDEPIEDYPSEYYDDVEEPAIIPVPPPRPTVRVVKRPFLPSRGGNPNPRGLSPVGSKALTSSNRDENPLKQYVKQQTLTTTTTTTTTTTPAPFVSYSSLPQDTRGDQQSEFVSKPRPYDVKPAYNAYKTLQQVEAVQKQYQPHLVNDKYELTTKPAQRLPELNGLSKRRPEVLDQESRITQKTTSSWSNDYGTQSQRINDARESQGVTDQQVTRNPQNDNSDLYSPNAYKNVDPQEQFGLTGNNYQAKQKINEVTHHNLQDIPESEYDVTLNEALTPNLSQEPSLPSGFVLPLSRQFHRDAILQPSENSYKVSRLQHNPFIQPQASIARNSNTAETSYYRTPETIPIAGNNQYRQQRQWSDYSPF